jgi:toluene monooxygenase system protein D
VNNAVGPILRMGDDIEEVIAAIEDDNPDTEVEVIDRGSYVRVQGEGRLVLTEQALQRYLGKDYVIRSIQTMMPSFAGRIITSSDSITWENISSRHTSAASEGAPS